MSNPRSFGSFFVRASLAAIVWASFACGIQAAGDPASAPASTPASAVSRGAGKSPTADRVLVIYNANWTGDSDADGVQDSLQVAQYYMKKRLVPEKNLLALKCTKEAYSAKEYELYFDEVVAPIQAKLTELGTTDIDVLLMSYGLPFSFQRPSGKQRLAIDTHVMAPWLWTRENGNQRNLPNPYMGGAPTFHADLDHFSHAKFKANGKEMYLVTRLDGPVGAWGCLDLIDRALYADRYAGEGDGCFKGVFYIDSQARGGQPSTTLEWLAQQPAVKGGSYAGYAETDYNIAYAASYLQGRKFTLKWESAKGETIGTKDLKFSDGTSAETAPRAFFYGGWYNINTYKNVFEWLPGAVACDLNSGSLTDYHMRLPQSLSWGPQAIRRGVTCVLGVVDEPYTQGHPRPNIACYYLLQGYSFAEIASLANPMIGWTAMNIGDPLYQPLRPGKSPTPDKQSPRLEEGYPKIAQGEASGTEVLAVVKDAPEPEVVKLKVEYGLAGAYGKTIVPDAGFCRRYRVCFADLEPEKTYHYRLVLTDPVGNVTATGDSTFVSPKQSPLGGKPAEVPGVIQAENFDAGGQGLAYYRTWPAAVSQWQYRKDTSVPLWATKLEKGKPAAVFFNSPGDWYKYTIQVAKAGEYDIDVACTNWAGAGGTLHVEIDGADKTGPIVLPKDAPKDDNWAVVTAAKVRLEAGQHVMKVCLDTASDAGISPLNFYEVRPAGSPPATASAPAAPPASKPAK